MLRALTIFAALVALASLPCLIAMVVVGLDDLSHRTGGVVDRLRTLKIPGQPHRDLLPLGPQEEDSIEQVASDLRDLSRALEALRGLKDPGAEVRREALRRAYETRLQDACRSLDVDEHLDDLVGMDREIEILRIEGVLVSEGLVLRTGQRHRGREST
ncbi:MAG: hypothetical protein ACRDUA_04895 [Micromonosporaceae bacterium]